MNLIPKIAEMLGVEIGEEFEIRPFNATQLYKSAKYHFTEYCFQYYDVVDKAWRPSDELTSVLNGISEIVKLPFEPKEHERYWYVYVGDDEIGNTRFSEANTNDLMRVYCGNCFRTEAEAEKHKFEIYEKLTGRKWEE